NIVEPGERIVERVHKEPTHQIDDQHAPLAYRMEPPAGTRRRLWEVRGTQYAGIAVDIGDDLPLVPDVVAGGQDVDAGVVQLTAKASRKPKPAGRVLRVDDNKVERDLLPQDRYMLLDGVAARTADHIPAKQNDHSAPFPDPGELERRGGAALAVGVQT